MEVYLLIAALIVFLCVDHVFDMRYQNKIKKLTEENIKLEKLISVMKGYNRKD